MASSTKPAKKVHRLGAFLRLYGPVKARTHAKLVLGHEPRDGTPEAFFEELEQEEKYNRWNAGPDSTGTVQLRPTFIYR